MKLQKDLREFIELLNSAKIKYLLVGGHAVAYHGFPRFTGDMDFFIDCSASNLSGLAQVLADFGFAALAREVSPPTPAAVGGRRNFAPPRTQLCRGVSTPGPPARRGRWLPLITRAYSRRIFRATAPPLSGWPPTATQMDLNSGTDLFTEQSGPWRGWQANRGQDC